MQIMHRLLSIVWYIGHVEAATSEQTVTDLGICLNLKFHFVLLSAT